MSFLALAQRFLYFHFWLFLCVGCRFCFCFFFVFCFGSNRLYARRCFVHLEMYSHCRCVPALRGQSFWDSEEFCSDGGRSLLLLGFPTQAWRSVACSWFTSPSFLLLHLPHRMLRAKFLAGSERSVLVFLLQLEWTRRLRRLGSRSSSSWRVATSMCETTLHRCLRHRREWTMAAPPRLLSSSRGVCGGVVALRFTMLFPLYVMFASLQRSG